MGVLSSICGAVAIASICTTMVPKPDTVAPQRAVQQDTVVVMATDSVTGQPVREFDVLLTSLTARVSSVGVRISSSAVRVAIDADSVGYLLRVSAAGYSTLSRRLGVPEMRLLRDTVRVRLRRIDANGVALDAVRVQATRPKPSRNDNSTAGSLDTRRSAAGGSVDPTASNSVSAVAAGFSNVQSTADGLSVFGLSGNQSSVTLNGLQFSDASLPRNLSTSVRLLSNVFDPAKGWYSGAETQISIDPGSTYAQRLATASREEGSASALANGQRGARSDRTVIGLGASGIAWRDRVSYNGALDIELSSSPIVTLENASSSEWLLSGTSPRIAHDVMDAGRQLGIATNPLMGRDRRELKALSFAARVNTPLEDPNLLTEANRSMGVTIFGSTTRENPTDFSSYVSASTLRQRQRSSIGGQLEYSYFPSPATLLEFSTGLSEVVTRSEALSAVSRFAVELADGSGAQSSIQAFALGGSGSGNSEARTAIWESRAVSRFYLPGTSSHRLQLTLGARKEYADTRSDGAASTLTFRSLDDLLRRAPVLTERRVQDPLASAHGTNMFFSVGDYWRPARGWQLMLGGRLERASFPTVAYSASVLRDSFPHISTDQLSSWHFSPRVGLSWQYKTGGQGMVTMSSLGTVFSPLPGVLKIGIGEFRAALTPQRLLQQASIGRAAVTESCWYPGQNDIASFADDAMCVGAVDSRRDTLTQYRILGTGFAPPRSWRANAATAFDNRWASLQVELAASVGLDQPLLDPINLRTQPVFMDGLEGRAVYLSSDAITRSGGVLRSGAALARPSLGNVLRTSSDGRILATQSTVVLQPSRLPFFSGIGYTLSSVREYTSNFNATAFSSVAHRGWRRAPQDARHTFVLQFGKFWNAFAVSAFGVLRSGVPFNPVWAADVNGDGRANDRVTQSLFASQFPNGGGRGCVARLIEGREFPECQSPWSVTTNAQLVVTGRGFSPAWSRVTGRLFFANVAGLLDRAINGSDLRGWGRTAAYDAAAFQVGSFDHATRSFVPIRNAQFGSNRMGSSGAAPFRIVADVSINLSIDSDRQQLDRYVRSGRAGRSGKRYTADELLTRYARTVPDAYERLLSFRDSVRLSNDQIRSLMTRRTAQLAKVNGAWRDLATWLHDLPDTFDSDLVVRRQKATTNAIWEMNRLDVQSFLPTLLTPEQILRLPYPTNALMSEKKPFTAQR